MSQHMTLEDVMTWGIDRVHDMISQDEFSIDVIVRYDADLYLVYGVTWLGAVTAVAVWDKYPTAQDLLDARLSDGWTPVASTPRHK